MTIYERRQADVGNIIALEHVNLAVPDQQLATAFYIAGLGFTRDPYMFTGLENMWVNIGRSQCHLPSRGTQRQTPSTPPCCRPAGSRRRGRAPGLPQPPRPPK